MLKRPNDSYELAKMAVTSAEQGKGIGKLDFREFAGEPSPYERSDIQMELWLAGT